MNPAIGFPPTISVSSDNVSIWTRIVLAFRRLFGSSELDEKRAADDINSAAADERALLRLGDRLHLCGQTTWALEAYWRAVQLHQKRNEHLKAHAILSRVLLLAPRDIAVRRAVADSFERLERKSEAADHFRVAAFLSKEAGCQQEAAQLWIHAEKLCPFKMPQTEQLPKLVVEPAAREIEQVIEPAQIVSREITKTVVHATQKEMMLDVESVLLANDPAEAVTHSTAPASVEHAQVVEVGEIGHGDERSERGRPAKKVEEVEIDPDPTIDYAEDLLESLLSDERPTVTTVSFSPIFS